MYFSSCSHFCYWDGFRLEHTIASLDIFWPLCLAWLVPFSESPLTFSARLGRKKSWLEIETLVMMQTKPKRNDKPQLPIIHSEQNSEDGLYFLKCFICYSLLTPNNNNKDTGTFHIEKLPGHPVMSGMKAGPHLDLPQRQDMECFTEPLHLSLSLPPLLLCALASWRAACALHSMCASFGNVQPTPHCSDFFFLSFA